ncbi:MAG: ATP-dependent DNA helicase RecQ, partial [Candidatus Gracilibacteria bacterium]|nr:ATP-dependent DNA helicase RecQ [Candidatus Gracilibacteria bacterium]
MSIYKQNLKKYFGFDEFRFSQEEIVKSVVEGKNTLVFMPTGGGKSLTYQLPGLMREGVAIIISPLISLMKDQVDALRERGISAELINSTIDYATQQNILNEVSKNNDSIKFLYIAPERLNSQNFLRVLQNVKISLIAIDEAHCISQWGHDFRPSYMKVKDFINKLLESNSFPVMGLTATATQKVKKDIVERLGLEDISIFTSGFDRKNIVLVVREISKKDEKKEKVFEILSKTPGSGIIYCSSRKAVDEVYDFLIENGVKAGKYTGAMTADIREDMQNKFMNDDYKVVVATNAFGMGIDKKDIRFVIHYNLPGSIENYYQEVGRAGRDGKMSYGIVLASYGDTKIQEFFIENSNPPKQEILDFYDYLHSLNSKEILKTQFVMATESNLNNAMKVGTILKILEKYGILKKGVEDGGDFRGRGVTLTQEKREHSHLMIDWSHQVKLEDEAYFKLEQV